MKDGERGFGDWAPSLEGIDILSIDAKALSNDLGGHASASSRRDHTTEFSRLQARESCPEFRLRDGDEFFQLFRCEIPDAVLHRR